MTDRDALRSLLLYAHLEAKAQDRNEVSRLLALALDVMARDREQTTLEADQISSLRDPLLCEYDEKFLQ